MRIVYMGTPDFAVPALKAMAKSGHEILYVVTQPDRAKGRSDKPVFSPVKEAALSMGIPVLQPEKIREEAAVETLRGLKADVFVVAAFGQILPKSVLELPKYGCINIHASLLPKYRGASPIQAAILNGDSDAGVTVMQMDVGMDTGDILLQKSIPLSPAETGGSLFDKLSNLGAQAILEVLELLEKGGITPEKQDDSKATLVELIDKKNGHIDWRKPAAVLERQIRAFDPWPGSFTDYNGRQMRIWRAEAMEDTYPGMKRPGIISDTDKMGFYVQTGEGLLYVTEIQLPGKKRMQVSDFFRGNSFDPEQLLK